MQTFHIQLILGELFEDLYIKARTEAEAIKKAQKQVATDANLKAFRSRWTRYVA